MTTQQRILTPIYAALWIFMAWLLYSDALVWKTDDVRARQVEAIKRAKAVR